MEFRTELPATKAAFSLALDQSFVTIGSCFSDAIGQRLAEHKFRGLINPTGAVYNPISIHNLLRMATLVQAPRLDGYCSREDVILHHDFHSSFFHKDRTELESKLTYLLLTMHQAIQSCRVLMITYGTAWAYEQISTKQVVANCHKAPQIQFKKNLLTQELILESFNETINLLHSLNPSLHIVITVSPVRHIKDTLPLNSVSKAALRLVCHTLTQQYSQVSYFPAYELMQDDLRDYRFYEADLIHPSSFAIDYIWQKFSATYFDTNTQQFLLQWAKLNSALKHKAFNGGSAAHRKFLMNLEAELMALSNVVSVQDELQFLRTQLGSRR